MGFVSGGVTDAQFRRADRPDERVARHLAGGGVAATGFSAGAAEAAGFGAGFEGFGGG